MARLLKKPLVIALAAVILLVIGFFAYIQNAFTGTRCEAAKHLDADMIGDCYGCHLKVTPQVAQDWYESKHGVTLVRCQVCHGQPSGQWRCPVQARPRRGSLRGPARPRHRQDDRPLRQARRLLHLPSLSRTAHARKGV